MNTQTDRIVLPVMIGTAGHVDHGKTSLVKRLTGFDTDRLKEEKERGLSIDFGVAPFDLEGIGQLGLIDVPGHEDFIRNMVAGASSIDILLLVVAADDAVMPQTIEHLKIARLMGMRSLMVAMTKIDLVSDDLIALVEDDIRGFLAPLGYGEAKIVPVSNADGRGIEEVRQELKRIVGAINRQPDERAFRMYVRHVFSAKGRGTVITGVPASGTLNLGDEIELLPGGKRSGVRGIQNYREESTRTEAHISSAINLRDLDQNELSRGMAICTPGIFAAGDSALVHLRNSSSDIELKRKSEVRFLIGTAKAVGRLVMVDKDRLHPGEEAFARVRFTEPVVLAAGDRFIARTLSPAETIGGGTVLSVRIKRVRRSIPGLAERLEKARAAAERLDVFASELLAGGSAVIRLQDLPLIFQRPPEQLKPLLAERVSSGILKPLGADAWVCVERQGELIAWMKRSLGRYHRANKYSLGMKPTYAAELAGLSPASFNALAELLVSDPAIVVRHGSLALKDFSPQISQREAKLRESVLAAVKAAGANSVARGNIQQDLQMTVNELKLVTKLLAEEKQVTVLGSNLLSQDVVEKCREILLNIFREQQILDLKTFRDRTGLSRNVGVALLEHFDNEGLTKRSGEGRVLVATKAKRAVQQL